MTRRTTIAAAFVVLVALVFALYQGGNLAWHLLGVVLVVLVIAFASQLGPLNGIEVTRQMRPAPYYAGEALTMTLTVRLPKWPFASLLLTDHLPGSLGVSEPRFVLQGTSSKPVILTYQIPALKRGVYQIDKASITLADLFGIFSRTRDIPCPTSFIVWPAIVALPASNLWSRDWQGHNPASRPMRTDAVHLRGIREYVPGDRLSHVHWKTSAHTGDFKVKQFEPETKPQVTLVLDHAVAFRPTDWETALSIAASIIYHAYQSQQVMGLSVLDRPDIFHSAAMASPSVMATMMNFLSELPYQEAQQTHILSPVAQGTELLVITSVAQQALWEGHADQVIAVGPGSVQGFDDITRVFSTLSGERVSADD